MCVQNEFKTSQPCGLGKQPFNKRRHDRLSKQGKRLWECLNCTDEYIKEKDVYQRERNEQRDCIDYRNWVSKKSRSNNLEVPA